MKAFLLVLLCVGSVTVHAQVERCTNQQKLELSSLYDQFRSASRAGDLNEVKTRSSQAVSTEIAEFEKTSSTSKYALARQIGSVMPALAEAKDLKCESSGKRARLIIRTDAIDSSSKKTIPITSIIMFERASGQKWLIGEKAMTNPFASQAPESLLQHESLRLP